MLQLLWRLVRKGELCVSMIGVDQYSYILIIIRIPITVLQSSFAEIARLLSEFFRELDVVPSDVLAGLIMLRQRQQQARQTLINQVVYRV